MPPKSKSNEGKMSPFYAGSEKLSMTQLSSTSASGRRSTWQTRGGMASSLGNSTNSIVIANGSINTLNTLSSDDLSTVWRPRILIGPIVASLLLVLLYVVSGAAILSKAQGWTYTEGLYFCFVALFTVGFGGLRPEEPDLWPFVCYIFFGLAVLSTCFYMFKDAIQGGGGGYGGGVVVGFRGVRKGRLLRRRKHATTMMTSLENVAKRN